MCLPGTCNAEKNHQQPCSAADDVVIMDMEAGLEHLGREHGDHGQFIVVIEPGAEVYRPIRM